MISLNPFSAGITMKTQKTQVSCQLKFKSDKYIADLKESKAVNKQLAKEIKKLLKKNSVLNKNSISNNLLHLTLRLEGPALDDLKDDFCQEAQPMLEKSLVKALKEFKVKGCVIELGEHDLQEEGVIIAEFGSNTFHSDTAPLIEVHKPTQAKSNSVIAKCYQGQKWVMIDRFVLESANEPEAAALIGDHYIAIRVKSLKNGSPRLYCSNNWTAHWEESDLVIQYPQPAQLTPKAELRFHVDINRALLCTEKKEPEEPLFTLPNEPQFDPILAARSDVEEKLELSLASDEDSSEMPGTDEQKDLETGGMFEPHPEELLLECLESIRTYEPDPEYTEEDENQLISELPQENLASIPTIPRLEPFACLKLKYLITQGEYFSQLGLAQEESADCQPIQEKEAMFKELGITAISPALTAPVVIELPVGKSINIGRSNDQMKALQHYLAQNKAGETVLLALFGMSRSHLVAEATTQGITLTPAEGSCSNTCFLMTKEFPKPIPVTESVSVMNGDLLVLGAFVFECDTAWMELPATSTPTDNLVWI